MDMGKWCTQHKKLVLEVWVRQITSSWWIGRWMSLKPDENGNARVHHCGRLIIQLYYYFSCETLDWTGNWRMKNITQYRRRWMLGRAGSLFVGIIPEKRKRMFRSWYTQTPNFISITCCVHFFFVHGICAVFQTAVYTRRIFPDCRFYCEIQFRYIHVSIPAAPWIWFLLPAAINLSSEKLHSVFYYYCDENFYS